MICRLFAKGRVCEDGTKARPRRPFEHKVVADRLRLLLALLRRGKITLPDRKGQTVSRPFEPSTRSRRLALRIACVAEPVAEAAGREARPASGDKKQHLPARHSLQRGDDARMKRQFEEGFVVLLPNQKGRALRVLAAQLAKLIDATAFGS